MGPLLINDKETLLCNTARHESTQRSYGKVLNRMQEILISRTKQWSLGVCVSGNIFIYYS